MIVSKELLDDAASGRELMDAIQRLALNELRGTVMSEKIGLEIHRLPAMMDENVVEFLMAHSRLKLDAYMRVHGVRQVTPLILDIRRDEQASMERMEPVVRAIAHCRVVCRGNDDG